MFYLAVICDRTHHLYEKYSEIRVREIGSGQYYWEEMDELFDQWQILIISELDE